MIFFFNFNDNLCFFTSITFGFLPLSDSVFTSVIFSINAGSAFSAAIFLGSPDKEINNKRPTYIFIVKHTPF